MTSHSHKPAGNRLLQSSEDVSRIAASLTQVSADLTSRPAEAAAGREKIETTAEQIEAVIHRRRRRKAYFPQDLLWDPAWDMMLELLRCEVRQQRVIVSTLCGAAGVPATTALRWLKNLEERGLVLRHTDPLDGRRIFVELSDDASSRLRQWFADSFAEAV